MGSIVSVPNDREAVADVGIPPQAESPFRRSGENFQEIFPRPYRYFRTVWRGGTHDRRCVAEREGFEPSIRFCRILTFQASAFDHSATAPHLRWKGAHLESKRSPGKVAARNDRP